MSLNDDRVQGSSKNHDDDETAIKDMEKLVLGVYQRDCEFLENDVAWVILMKYAPDVLKNIPTTLHVNPRQCLFEALHVTYALAADENANPIARRRSFKTFVVLTEQMDSIKNPPSYSPGNHADSCPVKTGTTAVKVPHNHLSHSGFQKRIIEQTISSDPNARSFISLPPKKRHCFNKPTSSTVGVDSSTMKIAPLNQNLQIPISLAHARESAASALCSARSNMEVSSIDKATAVLLRDSMTVASSYHVNQSSTMAAHSATFASSPSSSSPPYISSSSSSASSSLPPRATSTTQALSESLRQSLKEDSQTKTLITPLPGLLFDSSNLVPIQETDKINSTIDYTPPLPLINAVQGTHTSTLLLETNCQIEGVTEISQIGPEMTSCEHTLLYNDSPSTEFSQSNGTVSSNLSTANSCAPRSSRDEQTTIMHGINIERSATDATTVSGADLVVDKKDQQNSDTFVTRASIPSRTSVDVIVRQSTSVHSRQSTDLSRKLPRKSLFAKEGTLKSMISIIERRSELESRMLSTNDLGEEIQVKDRAASISSSASQIKSAGRTVSFKPCIQSTQGSYYGYSVSPSLGKSSTPMNSLQPASSSSQRAASSSSTSLHRHEHAPQSHEKASRQHEAASYQHENESTGSSLAYRNSLSVTFDDSSIVNAEKVSAAQSSVETISRRKYILSADSSTSISSDFSRTNQEILSRSGRTSSSHSYSLKPSLKKAKPEASFKKEKPPSRGRSATSKATELSFTAKADTNAFSGAQIDRKEVSIVFDQPFMSSYDVEQAMKRLEKSDPFWEFVGRSIVGKLGCIQSSMGTHLKTAMQVSFTPNKDLSSSSTTNVYELIECYNWQNPLRQTFENGEAYLILRMIPVSPPLIDVKSDCHIWPKGTFLQFDGKPQKLIQRKESKQSRGKWKQDTCRTLDVTFLIKDPGKQHIIEMCTYDEEAYYYCLSICRYRSEQVIERSLLSESSHDRLSDLSIALGKARITELAEPVVLDDEFECTPYGHKSPENKRKTKSDGHTTVSMLCPISKLVMKKPVRGKECIHFQCFDLQSYLEMNRYESAFRWRCGAMECSNFLSVRDLEICRFTEDCIEKNQQAMREGRHRLWFNSNGAYMFLTDEKKQR